MNKKDTVERPMSFQRERYTVARRSRDGDVSRFSFLFPCEDRKVQIGIERKEEGFSLTGSKSVFLEKRGCIGGHDVPWEREIIFFFLLSRDLAGVLLEGSLFCSCKTTL